MRIVAIDPGKICGLVLLDTEPCPTIVMKRASPFKPDLVSVEVGMDEVEEWLDSWHDEGLGPLEVVIIERWMIYPFALHKLKFHECPAAEAIGIVRSWCNRNDLPLTRQMASVRMPYLTKARTILGLTAPHRAAALAHALCWFKVNKLEILDFSGWKIEVIKRRKKKGVKKDGNDG